jgi:DNA-binding response OmpR family regulator
MQSYATVGDNLAYGLVQRGWKLRVCRSPPQLLSLQQVSPAEVLVLTGTAEVLFATQSVRAAAPDAMLVMLARGASAVARIAAMQAGADACYPPDICAQELVAALSALDRKRSAVEQDYLGSTPWHLAENGRALLGPSQQRLPLTLSERVFLTRLLAAPGHCLAREQLFPVLAGAQPRPPARHVDVLVSRLRRKAQRLGLKLPLLAVRGWGYIMLPERV